jgi:hypothetical protein
LNLTLRDDDGTSNDGNCLKPGTECNFLSTCNECCGYYSHWDSNAGSMKCGIQECLADGTECIPELTCWNCCNMAYDNNGLKCGGTSLAAGTECDYYTSCQLCSGPFALNKETGKYECEG